MKKENFSLFLGLIFTLGLLVFIPSLAQAGALTFTVAPATNNVDNLVNQASTTWRFTIASSTTALATSTDAVEITFPAMQGPNWSMTSLIASSSDSVGGAQFGVGGARLYALGLPAPAAYFDGGNWKVVIMATSSMTAATGTLGYVIDVTGIDNPVMQKSSFGAFNWGLRTCTLAAPGDPTSHCTGGSTIDSTSTPARATLTRRGDVVDTWTYSATSSPISAKTSYLVTFTASTTAGSALSAGERIWINFPAGFNVSNATTSAGSIASTGNATIVAAGISATTTNSLNAVVVAINSGNVAAGDTVTIAVNDVVNPAKGAYATGLRVFTTTAKGGLIDGTIMGYENTFGFKPPPVEGLQIGGTNTLYGQVKLNTGTTTRNLFANEAGQIQVGMGCPDKNFFAGTKRLDSQGRFTYNNLLPATYMMGVMPLNTNDPTFFINYLQPSRLMVSLTDNETATVTPTFVVPDGFLRGSITGGVANYSAQMVAVRAYTGSTQSFSPLFTDTTYTTQGLDSNGRGYFRLPVKSDQTWNFAMEFGGGLYYLTDGSNNQYWAPSASPVYIATSTQTTTTLTPWSFVAANKTINVTLQDQTGAAITGSGGGPAPCLSIKRSGSEMMGPGGQGVCATTDGVYVLKVPAGSFSITVMMPGMGMNESPVTVLSTDTTVSKTIVVSRATTYITGTVTDPDTFPIQGVNVMAQGSNGSFSQALTNSSGVYTMYVSPGLYQLNAFAPGYGQLAVQNVTVLASPGFATQNYTIDSILFKTISGRVFTDANSDGVYATSTDTTYEGVYLNAYGNGGGNQAMSRSDGIYTLRVPAAAGYTVEAWSKTTGFIGTSTANATNNVINKNFIVAAQGTLQITVSNANLYGVTQMFASAYSTSTGRGGGSDTWTASTTATDLATSFSVPAGYYKLDVNTPGFGNLTSRTANAVATATAVVAGETKSFTISLPDLVTVSGTVTANATVWASRTDGPGKYNTASTSDGRYSLKLPSDMNYMIGASLSGYVNTPVTLSSLSVNTTQNLTLTLSAYTISGAVTSGGAAVSEGFAWATKASNTGWIGSEIDASGRYSLGVDSGTWTVYASAPCLQASNGVSQTGSGTVNFALTSISGCSFGPPQMSSIVPSNGGTVATSGISVNIPANALGSGTSNVSFSVNKPTTVPPATLNATPIGNAAKSISASDSNGTSISTLSNSVEVAITYSDSDIVGITESNLQLAYWNTTTGTWDPIAATLDTVNNTLTGRVDHLSDFAPIYPVGESAPATPANLAATRNGDGGMSLTWDSVSGASYLLYRDTSASGSFPYLTTKTSTSHSDTGLTGGTTYYYKVTASSAGGESAASSAVSAATCSSVGSGTVSGASCTLSSCNAGYTISGGSCVLIGGGGPSGGGSGSAPSIPAQTTTPAATPQVTPSVPSPTLAAPSVSVPSVSAVFTKVLKTGSIGSDIKRLQQLLNSDPDTAIAKSGVGSLGRETTTFGSLTKEAVKKFQCKYNIVCSGDESTTGYGLLGPKTRAKVAEVFGSQAAVQQPSAPTQPVPAASQTAVSNIQSQIQILLQKIQELQTKLNAM